VSSNSTINFFIQVMNTDYDSWSWLEINNFGTLIYCPKKEKIIAFYHSKDIPAVW